jgi:hypothetical protein
MIAADLQTLRYHKKSRYAQILAKELEYILHDFGAMATNGTLLAAFSFSGKLPLFSFFHFHLSFAPALNKGPENLGRQGREWPWRQWGIIRQGAAAIDRWDLGDGHGHTNSGEHGWYNGSPLELALGKYIHSPGFEIFYTAMVTTAFVCNLSLVCKTVCIGMFGPISALHAETEEHLQVAVRKIRASRLNCLRLQFICIVLFAVAHVLRTLHQWRLEIGTTSTLIVAYFIHKVRACAQHVIPSRWERNSQSCV